MRQQLLELEQQFWKGSAEFYRRHLAPDAVMVFADPVGVLDRDAVVASIGESARWRDVELTEVRELAVSPDALLLIYRGSAQRDDLDRPYTCHASSLYVRRDGDWKLAFHQQTPASSYD